MTQLETLLIGTNCLTFGLLLGLFIHAAYRRGVELNDEKLVQSLINPPIPSTIKDIYDVYETIKMVYMTCSISLAEDLGMSKWKFSAIKKDDPAYREKWREIFINELRRMPYYTNLDLNAFNTHSALYQALTAEEKNND